jgi:hypothetical protein
VNSANWPVLPICPRWFAKVIRSGPGSQNQVGAMAADEGKVKIEKFDGADLGF